MHTSVVSLLYRRVSSEEQAREGLSLEAQQSETRWYAARHGWSIGGEFVDVLTGTRADRPQYQALLTHARRQREQGRQTTVVVARLDRFGRSVFERARCAEELRALDIPIHSVHEGGVLPQLVADLLAAVAEEEVRRLGAHLAATHQFVADSGWHYPTRPAWGYRRRSATPHERACGAPHTVLEPDPRSARYVREVFARAERGESVASITAWVQRLSAEIRGQRKMSYFNVRMLLARPVYVARHRRGSPNVLSRPLMRWSPLISDDVWRRVRAQLETRTPVQGTGIRRYLLAGLIHCARCGARMGGNRNTPQLALRNGWQRQPRYVCMGRSSGAGGRSLDCYESAMLPSIDRQVVQEVSWLFSTWTDRSARRVDNGSGQPPQRLPERSAVRSIPTAPPRVDAATRQQFTALALRLVDGRIGAAAYARARDRLIPNATAQVHSAAARELDNSSWPNPSELARAWEGAVEAEDVSALRRILHELVTRVVPIRRRRGEYDIGLGWTRFAQIALGAESYGPFRTTD